MTTINKVRLRAMKTEIFSWLTCCSGNRKNSLWKFLYRLLESPNQENDNLLQWVDRKNYIFRVVQTAELAHRWGQEKNKVNMNYDKLSRALRQYKHGEVQKVPGQKLIFKFGHVVMKDDYKTSWCELLIESKETRIDILHTINDFSLIWFAFTM